MITKHKPRFCPRLHLRKPLRVEYHHSYCVPLSDLSRNGAFIEDEMPFFVGQAVPLTIWLDDCEPIEVEAVVRRRSPRQHGLGVEFVGMSARDSEHLRRFLAAQAKAKKAS